MHIRVIRSIAQARNGLATPHGVALGHLHLVHIGIDRQQVAGVADHDDRHAFGASGDGGNGACRCGLDRGAGGGLDIDTFVAALGIVADDAALHRQGHPRRFCRGGGFTHIGNGCVGGRRCWRICGIVFGQWLGRTGRCRCWRSGPRRSGAQGSAPHRCGHTGHGDQQKLALTHGKVSAQSVPFGQRFGGHLIEARDGKGGFAAFHLVADRLLAGLRQGRARRSCDRRRGGIVDRIAGQRRHIHGGRLDRAGAHRARRGRGLGDAAGQGDDLAPAQRHIRLDPVVARQIGGGQAHTCRHIVQRIAPLGDRHLIVGIRDNAAAVGAGPVRRGGLRGLGRGEPATQPAQVKVQRVVAPGQSQNTACCQNKRPAPRVLCQDHLLRPLPDPSEVGALPVCEGFTPVLLFSQAFEQGDKADIAHFVIFEAGFGFVDADQALDGVGLTHRQHHDAAHFELTQQGAGGVFGGGCYDDPVKGGLIGQPERPIAGDCGDRVQAQPVKDGAGLVYQPPVPVNGIDAPGQFRQNRGLIARAGAHFEHLVAGADVQRLGHQTHNRGLADGLATGDGQGHILVGPFRKKPTNKGASVDLFHGLQHPFVRHPLGAERIEELHFARGKIVVGHVAMSLNWSSISWAVKSARIGVTEM
mmetsp:Transcript_23674/g.42179  ORF Transcript_23674/g.42179 Transcript_23674/m.42179 type:complete len:642 (+) Transcript_23674:690-2615(+)